MIDQADFARALLDPERSPPTDLTAWNGSDPAVRLAVYRNNVVVSLLGVLADTFPITHELVGEAFFCAIVMAVCRPQHGDQPAQQFERIGVGIAEGFQRRGHLGAVVGLLAGQPAEQVTDSVQHACRSGSPRRPPMLAERAGRSVCDKWLKCDDS